MKGARFVLAVVTVASCVSGCRFSAPPLPAPVQPPPPSATRASAAIPTATSTPEPRTTPLATASVAVLTATPTPTLVEPTATPTPTLAEPTPTSTPVPTEVTVAIDENRLTKPVNDALTGQPLVETMFGAATVRWVAVQIRYDRIIVTGDAQAGPLILPVSMSGTVDVEYGRPVVRVREATVGGAIVPEAVRLQIEAILQHEVDAAVAEGNLDVHSTSMEPGLLTVSGRRRQ